MGAADMWVGIAISGGAVGGPSCMTNADVRIRDWKVGQLLNQTASFPARLRVSSPLVSEINETPAES